MSRPVNCVILPYCPTSKEKSLIDSLVQNGILSVCRYEGWMAIAGRGIRSGVNSRMMRFLKKAKEGECDLTAI